MTKKSLAVKLFIRRIEMLLVNRLSFTSLDRVKKDRAVGNDHLFLKHLIRKNNRDQLCHKSYGKNLMFS